MILSLILCSIVVADYCQLPTDSYLLERRDYGEIEIGTTLTIKSNCDKNKVLWYNFGEIPNPLSIVCLKNKKFALENNETILFEDIRCLKKQPFSDEVMVLIFPMMLLVTFVIYIALVCGNFCVINLCIKY